MAGRLPICDSWSGIVSPEPADGELRCGGVPWGVPGESDEEFAICPECRSQKYAFERARSYGQYKARWYARFCC
jgi:hypothetical protein